MATRRTLIQLIGAGIVAPRIVFAQSERKTLLVVLFPGDSESDERLAQPFFEEMQRLGWVEGTNITYERLSGRGAREYVENLAKIAAGLEPQLIYATTGTLALAAVKATESVPVLFMTAADPVASRLVHSLAKPGGNATGTYQFRKDTVTRCMHLVREAFPQQKRVGAVFDRVGAELERRRSTYQEAARHAGLDLTAVDFTNFEAIPKIFANLRRDGIRTVLVTPSFTLVANRIETGKFALRNNLALVGYRGDWAEVGALMSYGADGAESLKRSANLAHRILKGSRPADTPVEQVTKLELVINMTTAKTLGLTIPRPVLARANRVLE
jgi:putative ABC transport system substrate-binding protein